MVPNGVQMVSSCPDTVRVQVTGGSKTNPMGTSEILGNDFREAVQTSLRENRVFAGVEEGGQSDYRLDIAILSVGQPAVGLAMTVSMTTSWKLSHSTTGEKVWEDTISSSYTAKFSESVLGYERLRKANEGAARENIREALKRMSDLPIGNPIQLTGSTGG